MIGRTISHYRILDRLGEGGMGVVYRAEDIKLGRTVALKFLPDELTCDDEAKQRLLIEARAASQLDHPNICTIHDAGETDDGGMFLVMSHYEGETLDEKLKRGPLPVAEAVELARQIASGLDRAHESGIIHRDIKPANIIITRDGIAKILDFGIAKLSGQTVTRKGTLIGTVAYMSPEILRGEDPSPATDLWSLGVLLYETIAGYRPFDGDTEAVVILSIVNEPPLPIRDLAPHVPGDVAAIVARLLSKDPRERYASADELLSDLRAVSFGSEDQTAIRRLTGHEVRSARRPGILATDRRILAALAIVLVAGIAALLLRGRNVGVPTRAAPARSAQGRTMIAVLPFTNLGAPDDTFFADGITEEIISRLAAVEELGVISRTSVYAYDREGRSAKQIGKDLGVSYILDGTVQWEKASGKNRVRVTPQLVSVADDTHVWSDRYDRELADVFVVQDDIAEKVIRQLGIRLTENQTVSDRRLTSNVAAYELYLRAATARWTYAEPEIRAGIALSEQAIALDPRFAAAYALAGHLHVRVFHHGFDRSEARLALARREIDRALALDSASPEARTALGYYDYWANHDYEKALAEFAAARRVRPGDTSLLAGIAYAHRRQGSIVTALDELLDVQRLDPRNVTLVGEVAMTLQSLRRFPEAESVLTNGISDFPQAAFLHTLLFTNRLASSGSIDEARAALDASPRSDEEPLVSAKFALAMCARRGNEALRLLRESGVSTFVTTTTRGMWGAAHYPKVLLVAQAERLAGSEVRARASFESAREILEIAARETPDNDRVHSALGLAYAGLGRANDAIREGETGVRLCPPEKDAIDSSTRLVELAQIYAEVGQAEKALDTIERVLGMPAIFTPRLLRVDPAWDPLRSSLRFQQLSEPEG